MLGDFAERFSNWVRWCRADGHGQEHCGSIEHLFIQSNEDTSTGWGDWQTPDAAPARTHTPIDAVDAKQLDSIFLTLPDKIRRTIKLFYFKRHFRLEWIARKMGVHQSKIEETVQRAVDTFAMAVSLRERLASLRTVRVAVRIAA